MPKLNSPFLAPQQVHKDYWRSDKIRLRAIEPSDAAFFHAWINDTQMARNYDRIHIPSSFESTRRWAEKLAVDPKENDNAFWVIEDTKGSIVGAIQTLDCKRFWGTFKYKVSILKEQQRKGFAKEAVILICRYYFNELRYQKVNAATYSFNHASIEMHKTLGFIEEGRLRKMIFTNGNYYDEVIWGMTQNEFKSRFPG